MTTSVAVRARNRLRGALSGDDAATEFEESLEALLDRMTLLRNEHLES